MTPILYAGWWVMFVVKGSLRWKDIWPWLVYPAVYAAGTIVRGAVTESYPYWFVDVSAPGYGRVAGNSAGFTAGFLVAGLALIAADRWRGLQRPR